MKDALWKTTKRCVYTDEEGMKWHTGPAHCTTAEQLVCTHIMWTMAHHTCVRQSVFTEKHRLCLEVRQRWSHTCTMMKPRATEGTHEAQWNGGIHVHHTLCGGNQQQCRRNKHNTEDYTTQNNQHTSQWNGGIHVHHTHITHCAAATSNSAAGTTWHWRLHDSNPTNTHHNDGQWMGKRKCVTKKWSCYGSLITKVRWGCHK